MPVTPPTGSVLLGGRTLQLTSGTTNTSVVWSVNSTNGGNSSQGTISPSGLYSAPADLPSPASVQITAASTASPSSKVVAQITVISDISVGVSPRAASVELGAQQSFTAAISGAGLPDSSVRCSLSGAACSIACGSLSSTGLYTAPQILPSPAAVTLTAQSAADASKQASVTVTIASDFTPQIAAPLTISPSATAAIVATLAGVPGSNPSTILDWSLSGAGCSGAACGTLSSVTTQAVGVPSVASGADAEAASYTAPAAVSVPGDNVDLNIGALGIFSTGTNTCILGGNPVVLARPASGEATADICAFSQSRLDTSMSYTITGPGDLSVIAKQPAGLGIIHLTLQLKATAQPFFIQNLNLDKTAASGVLEVQ